MDTAVINPFRCERLEVNLEKLEDAFVWSISETHIMYSSLGAYLVASLAEPVYPSGPG